MYKPWPAGAMEAERHRDAVPGLSWFSDRSRAINHDLSSSVRLAHFSDIHVTAPHCVWKREDWFNKRLSAWLNLRLLGRGFRFRCTAVVLGALRADLRERGYDWVVFSGDATALGFREEVERAAHLLGVGAPTACPAWPCPATTTIAPCPPWRPATSNAASPPGSKANASMTRFIPSRSAVRSSLAGGGQLGRGQSLALGRPRRGRRGAVGAARRIAQTPGRRPHASW